MPRNPLAMPARIERALEGVEESIKVRIPVFEHGGRFPRRYTCDGENLSPPIEIEGVPGVTEALAVIMYDPDAPIGVFYHWGLYNTPPDIGRIPEGVPRKPETPYGLQATNDFGTVGYGGPCPPAGHGDHRYFFIVVALGEKLGVSPGSSIRRLLEAVRGKALAYGVYMGVYGR